MSTFAGGSGTSSDPYLISTPTHLNNVRDFSNTGYRYFKLINDINLDVSPFNSGEGWTPIPLFRGSFDCNGFKIKNLYINKPHQNDIGFFSKIDITGTVVKKIVLEDVNIVGYSGVGSVAGSLSNGQILKSKATGNVTGTFYVGGMVGICFGGAYDSKAFVNVNGSSRVGGFVGCLFGGDDFLPTNGEGKIRRCKSRGNVVASGDASSNIGGFVGLTENLASGLFAKLYDCVSDTSVSGNGNNVGGFAGLTHDRTIIERCISTSTVSGLTEVHSFTKKSGWSWAYFDKTLSNTGTGGGTGYTTSELKTTPIGSGIYQQFSTNVWFTESTDDYPDLEGLYHKVIFNAGSNGTLTGETTQRIDFAESGTFVTASGDTGFEFKKWDDDDITNPRRIENAKEDLSLTATFGIKIVTVSYTSGYNGNLIVGGVTMDTYTTNVEYGEDIQPVTIVPNENYSFIRWSDGSTDTTREDLAVTDDIIVYAIIATDLEYEQFTDIILNGDNALANTFSMHFFPQNLAQYKNPFLNQFIKKAIMYDTRLKNVYTESNDFNNGDGLHLNAIINSGESLDYRIYDNYDKTGSDPVRDDTVFSINKIDFSVNIFSNIIKDSGVTNFKYTDKTFNKQKVIATRAVANDGIEKKLRYIKLSGVFSKLTIFIMTDFPEDMFYDKLYKTNNSLYNSFISNGKVSSVVINRKDFEQLSPEIVGDRQCEVLLDVNRDIRFKPITGRNFTIVCVFDFEPTENIDGYVTKNRNILRRLSVVFEELPGRSKKF